MERAFAQANYLGAKAEELADIVFETADLDEDGKVVISDAKTYALPAIEDYQ